MPLDVARRGTLDVRDPPLKAIVAANDNYEAGYHKGNAGGLDAIDTDLATANIKNGITIFGKVGSADVHDISDATAIEAEVIAPETFYAVGGGIRTGTMPIVALAPGSSAYPAGYHAGDGGGLPAIDADLATANIKNGITIFNIAGSVDVRDVSDANALVGEVKTGSTFYAVGGARKTGTGTQTLNPANENVPAGYYAATTLSAVDAQLAAANILSGVNIFGFVGVATVQDIADADALVGQVLNPRTFYSVTGARKTGTMATVALAPGANAYPAGYHVGAASLTAVDGDLAAGNIADSITIFGVLGTLAGRDSAASEALLAMFQAWVAKGTMNNVANVNDNNTVTLSQATLNQYADVTFGDLVTIKRWRQFGNIGNAGDGTWKIQYWDVQTDAFVDWVTGIPTRVTADWSGFSTEAEVITTRIRLLCTAADTGSGMSVLGELEVIF